jgi:hypothetical protein
VAAFHDASERRRVRVVVPFEGVVDVRVRVDVEDVHGPAEKLRHRAHNRVGNRVVAPQHQGPQGRLVHDQFHGIRDSAHEHLIRQPASSHLLHRHVADVREHANILQLLPRFRGGIRAAAPYRLADSRRRECWTLKISCSLLEQSSTVHCTQNCENSTKP